jgi:hypothetical protein
MRQGAPPGFRRFFYHGSDTHQRITRLRPTRVTPPTIGHLHGHFTDKELRP